MLLRCVYGIIVYHPDKTHVPKHSCKDVPLPVINGVITPTNGLQKMALPWGKLSPYLIRGPNNFVYNDRGAGRASPGE